MASKNLVSTAILLSLNLLFFTLVSSKNVPCPPTPKSPQPHSKSPPSPKKPASCPKDTLKLGVLVDDEAAVCLCTALKASVLGINLNMPVSLSLLLNYCGKKVPAGYQCA
ncbi:hypothetical protein DITRI_Ditri04bG0109300 [Diplodiscus trichospermus]